MTLHHVIGICVLKSNVYSANKNKIILQLSINGNRKRKESKILKSKNDSIFSISNRSSTNNESTHKNNPVLSGPHNP